jgi:hypothetical protein
MTEAKRKSAGGDPSLSAIWVPSEWMLWGDALKHVEKVVGHRLVEAELWPKLRDGSVRWIDRYVGPDGKCETRNMPADVEFIFRGIWGGLRSNEWDRERRGGSHHVFARAADVAKCWGAPAGSADAVAPTKTRNVGRPEEHDYAGARAFLEDRAAANGGQLPKSQAAAIEILRREFFKRGGPKPRSIREKVTAPIFDKIKSAKTT